MNAPDRTAWLAERKKGIGGTDMAVILGLSPYKTPLALWMDKTGRAEDQHAPDAEERMYWGSALEDTVARRYAELKGVRIQRVNEPLVHANGIVRGNIDRAIVNPAISGNVRIRDGRLTTDRILEVKTAHAMARNSADWGPAGSDEVPQHYWIQVQTYLGLAQCESADLAVLFGGQKMDTYTIAADRELFADLLTEAEAWWRRHIVADVPPDPRCEDDARRLWKSHVAGREKIVAVDVADAVKTLSAIKGSIGTLEDQAQALRDRILPAFGDAEAISYMGRKLATWKANRAGSKTDWRAVAESLADQVSPEIFALIRDENTTTTEGARVLRLNTKES